MGSPEESSSTDQEQTLDPAESARRTGWLYGLNAFLERAFRDADRDTGC